MHNPNFWLLFFRKIDFLFRLVSFVLIGLTLWTLYQDKGFAQIKSDNTLGAENSIISPSVNGTSIITGGAIRGTNLFHSFEKFSVLNGETASFNNISNIQNIFSRVTGNTVSNIDGIINTNGTTNLFLINPNGIIFGANSQLNIGGSFIATTANAISFGNQGFFSATNPEQPALLTINPNVFIFNQIAPKPVTIQANWEFPENKNLFLVGGNINVDGATLLLPGGRVELGGLAAPGTVDFNINGDNVSLIFPDQVPWADINIDNGTFVNVRGSGSGSIAINANNLNIAGASAIVAGIAPQNGSISTIAKNIDIKAKNIINITDSSTISNSVRDEDSQGQAGNINIITESLFLKTGSTIESYTSGKGNAGNINVFANNTVALDGIGNDGYSTAINNYVSPTGLGNGGDINIKSKLFTVTDNAQLLAITSGEGNAGNLNINVADKVILDGSNSQPGASITGLFNFVDTDAKGNSGKIDIKTRSLSVMNIAQLQASTRGEGNAGDIIISATDSINFDDKNSNELTSGIFAFVYPDGKGNGGNIDIYTSSLTLNNGTGLTTSIQGKGNAGVIKITASNITLDGNNNRLASGIFSNVEQDGIGNGGIVDITANSLNITNGAEIKSVSRGQGNAGNLTINIADNLNINGVSSLGFSSGLLSNTALNAAGSGGEISIQANTLKIQDGGVIAARSRNAFNAGDISINANNLELTGGGEILTTAFGSGNAGNIKIDAKNNINISGADPTFTGRLAKFDRETVDPTSSASGIFVNTNLGSTGNGGELSIQANNLTIKDGGQITASSDGSGNAGEIENIITSNLTLNNGNLTTTSRSGEGGNIKNLQVQDLLILDKNSQISTTSGIGNIGGGNGGNININAGFIVGFPQGNSDITANAFQGNGGNINIITNQIFGLKFRSELTPDNDITASSQFGVSCNVEIITP
jgi:filamentous hemagglutinin family protein